MCLAYPSPPGSITCGLNNFIRRNKEGKLQKSLLKRQFVWVFDSLYICLFIQANVWNG